MVIDESYPPIQHTLDLVRAVTVTRTTCWCASSSPKKRSSLQSTMIWTKFLRYAHSFPRLPSKCWRLFIAAPRDDYIHLICHYQHSIYGKHPFARLHHFITYCDLLTLQLPEMPTTIRLNRRQGTRSKYFNMAQFKIKKVARVSSAKLHHSRWRLWARQPKSSS